MKTITRKSYLAIRSVPKDKNLIKVDFVVRDNNGDFYNLIL